VCLLAAEVVRGVSLSLLLRRLSPLRALSLLEVERAVREMLGENPIPPIVLEITYGPRLQALMQGELDKLGQEFPEDWQVPDFPPEEWGEPSGGEPPG
jgi:hypothetical protein